MTEQDVARIESAVGVTLPPHYRRFLLEHAKALGAARKKLDRPVLYATATDIIRINKGLHGNPRMIEVNEDADPWPLKYFVVGTNGGGDYWCVDLTDPREAIWFYDSEAGGVFEPAKFGSWAEYMDQLNEDLKRPKKR